MFEKLLDALVFIFVALIGIVAFAAIAVGLELPKDAKPFGAPLPIPCDGYVLLFDTNDSQEDGAEVAAVYARGEVNPRAVIHFGEGVEGVFKYALVQLPKMPEVRYDTPQSFSQAYQGPCGVVNAEGAL